MRTNAAVLIAATVLLALLFVGWHKVPPPPEPAPLPSPAVEPPELPQIEAPERVGDTRAERIDNYFLERRMPLAGHGKDFVEEADKNGIDWRLLPAIGVRESSGGKEQCGNNPFGWASCRGDNFPSIEEAIRTVSRHLGGNATSTRSYYSGDTRSKLNSYNPPSIVAAYTDEVIAIMQKISPEEVK